MTPRTAEVLFRIDVGMTMNDKHIKQNELRFGTASRLASLRSARPLIGYLGIGFRLVSPRGANN